MKKILLLACCMIAASSFAQTNPTSAEIYLGLKKLNTLGSVLYIAAHPDDENTRLLTYFSKDRLYRTGYLSLTRGDGGQNLIGDEQGIALGLIRTQELLSARKIDGAEQFFTRAYDFGFSKTPEETFTKWDKQKILADVVWVIRNFKPDVIITRFPTTGEGGHGHHTASAILANEAFNAAADPNRFPEQLKFIQPWQAKRILWNAFNFGGNNTTREDQFKFDVGGYNPVLGKSYGEIAADSRSQHKSQGFGVPRSRGEALEYFKATGGSQPTTDLFEDVVTDWSRVKGGEAVSQAIQSAITNFNFLEPQKSVPQLVQIYKAILQVPDLYWREQKRKEAIELIEQAGGLWLEAFTSEPYTVQGDSLRIQYVLNNRLGLPMKLQRVVTVDFDSTVNTTLAKNRNLSFTKTLFVSPNMPITQPYWLERKMEEGYFNVSDQMKIGQPDVDPALTAYFLVEIDGVGFQFFRPVKYKFTDPVKGELYQPLTVLPPVNVYTNPELLLLKRGEKEKRTFMIQARSNKRNNFKTAHIDAIIDKRKLSTQDASGSFTKGTSTTYRFELDPAGFNEEVRFFPSMRFDTSRTQNSLGLTAIKYDHIPNINYFYTDWLKAIPIDLKIHGKKVGYIVGAGDKVPEALEEMGYEVTLLADKELSRNNLQQFDAIISGVRAHNTNEWLNNHYDKLMKYVENGGNLIVQYNTSNQIGPVRAKIGPYNFNISRNRITDENAAVTFLKPEHPVLNFPNKITQNDFKGWVQERSIYHASGFDTSFQTIISMNDPNEQADAGSLIVARYGKGYFTYTGLVFFRQLPAGVPGAYRLLANLIALNRKREF